MSWPQILTAFQDKKVGPNFLSNKKSKFIRGKPQHRSGSKTSKEQKI
jgi:hypothetical protein